MRTSGSLLFSLVFLFFATFTAAWPWPRWLPELDSLVVRQDNNNADTSEPPATPTRPARTSSGTITKGPSKTNSDESSETERSGTARETGSQRTTGRTSSRTASKARTTAYDPTNPAGGVAMVTPAIIDGSQYYKIGDHVTFVWNYTNLLATPTAVNIVASCAKNKQLYTIASNQTVANSTQSVVWDTNAFQASNQANPLLTEQYTLIIYDAQSSISANAQPGYLAVYNQYSFGMYIRQEYKGLGEWVCSTCSGALGDMERRALGMVIGMGMLSVLSFSWFMGGTGVIW